MTTHQHVPYNPTMLIEPDTYRVVWVSIINQIPDDLAHGDRLVLQGPAAQWLYIALTGHQMGDPPVDNPILARAARAFLNHKQTLDPDFPAQSNRRDRPDPDETYRGFHIATCVVHRWGQFIRPWLGMVLVDAYSHKPIASSVYSTLISLKTNRPMPIEERVQVVNR